MPRKAASVTQADVARVVRAAQSAGLRVVRIDVRPDGRVTIGTGSATEVERPERDEARVIDL